MIATVSSAFNAHVCFAAVIDVAGKDLEVSHDYAENGDYFPVITGCIDEIESFTTNAIIVWERI